MSVDGIGGFSLFPLYIFDRPRPGEPTPPEQQAEDAVAAAKRNADNQRQALLAAERKAEQQQEQEKRLQRLDAELAQRQRTLDLADGTPIKRGSIIDIEV